MSGAWRGKRAWTCKEEGPGNRKAYSRKSGSGQVIPFSGFSQHFSYVGAQVDPKTGTAVEYLMPSGTNMRTVYVDNTTTPVTFWVGSNHDHRIVKVEPLD